ncbi:MAG: undecaprenyldiphospho-muramoylpentapeptide beta-N-acetylglucosaminyltransferase [Desulfobacterales bacterium]|nr:undecaprenyldiphospho-muramoylpentapeptide beta-N-acetylglucosaminyltransferase [Desulfobacterales bacterium]
MKTNKRVIIAGGKTGGHLFPGIAVAQALQALAPETGILFVGTDAPFEVNTLKRYGFAHKTITSRPIKGGSLAGKIWSAALVGVSLIQALYILIRFRADFILGVGGFSSFALVLAGRLLGRRTAIQEQNAVPGMTNRLLSRIAGTIFISFGHTRGMPLNPKTFLVGNPIRKQTGAAGEETTGETTLDPVAPEDFLILVTGGSQGAASINRAFTEAVQMIEDKDNIYIVHQTGQHSETEITEFYKDKGLRVEARAFFHDMPAIQDRADLVITRAGAGTLSELCIKGKPAILIPFPHAADDHQTANAKNLSDRGAALMVADRDLTGERLSSMISELKANPEKRKQMAEAMKAQAMPHGARAIASHILDIPDDALKGEK